MPTFQTLPGFRDFYPEDFARRAHIFRIWRQSAAAFGFSEYDAPVLEPLDLYRAKSGDEIETQLFSFRDKGDREVALRPEMTPSVCRLVGERAGSLKRPVKWFSIGEFYRYERMQRGRGRAFHQLNADIFGEAGPEAEIELIALLIECLRAFGLSQEDFFVRLSDRTLWLIFLRALGLGDEQSRAMLAAVDKFERSGNDAFRPYEEAHGSISEEVRAKVTGFLAIRSFEGIEKAFEGDSSAAGRLGDWRRLLGGLGAMGLSDFVRVDMGVVRGLAYYTGFVFEAFDKKGELRAIAGGGRYDDLVAKLGGAELPAVGFAIGDMTFALLLEQRGLAPAISSAPDIYCVIGGQAERRAAFADIQGLRSAGFRVEYPMREVAFGKQFKAASESGARLALIYGADELAKGVVKVRDLGERAEREIPAKEIAAAVKDFFTGR
ncbi:MAG TPA: histidine--tRNA ligase [Opitutaceae bacterium]|jgi:histidyl-tRNA synthetase